MRKILLGVVFAVACMFGIIGLEYVANTMYARSLRSRFSNIKHHVDSYLITSDYGVANCGGASNQCCFAYAEFRKVHTIEDIASAYAVLQTGTHVQDKAYYEIVTQENVEKNNILHTFFGTTHDDLFSRRQEYIPYAIVYIDSGHPAGLDMRCH